MKLRDIVLLSVIVTAAIYLVSPTTFTPILYMRITEGQTLIASGQLVLAENPPLSQIVLPVMVWRLDEKFYGITTGRGFYLARDGHAIAVIEEGFEAGNSVTVTGTIKILSDVNGNKVYLLDSYTISHEG